MAEFSISSLGQLMDDRILDNGDGTFSIVAEKIVDENIAPYKYGSNVQSFTAISSITAGQVVSTRHSNMISPTLVGGSSFASTAFGIAQTSASGESTVKVNVYGSVYSFRDRTLTIGAIYYIDDQGNLTTTENDAGGSGPGTYGKFGIALTTTEFLITRTLN